AGVDQLPFLLPADRAEIKAGEVQAIEFDHARADEAISKSLWIPFDLHDHDVRQQRAQMSRVEVRAQRDGIWAGALGVPIIPEALDAGRVDPRKIEPLYLIDHGVPRYRVGSTTL